MDFTEPEGEDYVGWWNVEIEKIGLFEGTFEKVLKIVRVELFDKNGDPLPCYVPVTIDALTAYCRGTADDELPLGEMPAVWAFKVRVTGADEYQRLSAVKDGMLSDMIEPATVPAGDEAYETDRPVIVYAGKPEDLPADVRAHFELDHYLLDIEGRRVVVNWDRYQRMRDGREIRRIRGVDLGKAREKIPVEGGKALAYVYVPTKYGGKLRVKTNRACTLEILHPQLGDFLQFEEEGWHYKDFSPQFDAATSEWRFFDPSHGPVIVWMTGFAQGVRTVTVETEFIQEGHARAPDGTPTYPWNFYYFPFVGFAQETKPAYDNYDTAFGTGAAAWAETHHTPDDAVQWEGFCREGVIASVLYEQPVAIHVNGVGFAPQEIELFLAQLSREVRVNARNDLLYKRMQRIGMFQVLEGKWKGNDKTPEPGTGDDRIDRDVSIFHHWLECLLRKEGRTFIANLRDPKGEHAGTIWNYAVYKYAAKFEALGRSDHKKKIVKITAEIYSNTTHDDIGAATHPGEGAFLRRDIYEYTIPYEASGIPSASSGDGDWSSAKGPDGTARFAPKLVADVLDARPAGFSAAQTLKKEQGSARPVEHFMSVPDITVDRVVNQLGATKRNRRAPQVYRPRPVLWE